MSRTTIKVVPNFKTTEDQQRRVLVTEKLEQLIKRRLHQERTVSGM